MKKHRNDNINSFNNIPKTNIIANMNIVTLYNQNINKTNYIKYNL